MRGAVLRATGDENLDVVDDLTLDSPGPGQVQIDIKATGLCHSDLSGMTGTIPQPAPAVLGHEGAGIITAVGEGVTSVQEGDHVIVAWSPPCGSCKFCIDLKSPQLCVNIQFAETVKQKFHQGSEDIFGFAGAGTFAEQTLMPEQGVVKIDDDVPLDLASLIGCAVMTGVGAAINTAKVVPGSSVVVFGAGGIGISVIQGARIAGAAEIVAVDMVDSKLETAKTFGATHAVKPDELDELKGELTGGDGFDYAFEAIGLSTTMRAAFDSVRRGGTATIVGVGKMDDMLSFNAFELFFAEKKLLGSYYGTTDVRSDFARLIRLWRYGKLDLEGMITTKMPIDDVNLALDAMRKGEVVRQVLTF
ncbi:Zn-dependent alcohol dehydrogenase [cyanobacterium TDX16]|nr:Zn-dependent alcohol dehydrogenase [cyanobacterium TDX16]